MHHMPCYGVALVLKVARQPLFRKIFVSVKFSARYSRAGNGCTNLKGAWNFCRKNHARKIPRFRGGGVFWVLGGGGGKCRFYFYGREDFSELLRIKL